MIDRHRRIAGQVESVTLIFDKGNCSADNLQALEDSPYHFISSLVPTHHPELLAVPARRFRSLAADGLPRVRAYRTTQEICGIERTVVVTYNEALFVAQSRTLLREIAKRQHQLSELQARRVRHRKGEVRGGKRPTMAGVRKTIDGYRKARHMKELFAIDLSEHEGLPVLTYEFRTAAWRDWQRTLLGKTILFTDQAGWSEAEIVRGYRGQHQVEVGVPLPEEPVPCEPPPATPLDRSEDPRACVLLCPGLAAVQPAEARTSPPWERPLDPGVAGGTESDPGGGDLDPGSRRGRATPVGDDPVSRLTEEQRRLHDALDLGRYASP